ncbi:hypothetical protein SAMN05216276_100579 [Streptosporangium subroseum]|uniref:Metalloprotease n=1 Tax=Streptosporangium subroseum TaxID=106412 RepID=A0A239CB54_9ACTN|nr:neutral zinc metallopeptidase [Streptosporangium subroseum]SNS16861.1 hypothetical protein SAMN05216276_100579 [Streptosporangium subroseum]
MRPPIIALLCGVLASVLFTGTASAGITERNGPVPTGAAALIHNPIYKTGKLDPGTCQQEESLSPGDRESARVYLEFVLDCLNDSWRQQLTKAKLPFTKPRFETTSRLGFPTGCGPFPKDAQALYCSRNNKITFLLSPGILSQANELFLFQTMAHEYGHHVQQLTGIMRTYASRKYRTEKEFLAEVRKVELQAECLSGAFTGSVWRSLNRRPSDFTYVLSYARSTASHGRGQNVAYWLTRGFEQESPGACNTFSAPKSKVA